MLLMDCFCYILMILKQNPFQDRILSADLFLFFASESSVKNKSKDFPFFYEEKTGLIRFSTVFPPSGIPANRIPPLHRRWLMIPDSFLLFGFFLFFLFAGPKILGHARSLTHGRFLANENSLPMSHVTFMTATTSYSQSLGAPKGTKVYPPPSPFPKATRLSAQPPQTKRPAGRGQQIEPSMLSIAFASGTQTDLTQYLFSHRISPDEAVSDYWSAEAEDQLQALEAENQPQAVEAGSGDGSGRGVDPRTEASEGNESGARDEGGPSAPGNEGTAVGDPIASHGDGSGSGNDGSGGNGGGRNDGTALEEQNTATQSPPAEQMQPQEGEGEEEEPTPPSEDPPISHENAGKKQIAFGVGFGIQKSFSRNVIKLSIKPTAVWEAQPNFKLLPDLKLLCMMDVCFGANEHSTPIKDGFGFSRQTDLTLFDLKFAWEKTNTIGQMGTSLSKVSVGGKPAQLLVRLGVDKLTQRVGYGFKPNPESPTYVMVGRVWGSEVPGHWQLQLENPMNLGTLTRDSGIPVLQNLELRAGSVSLTKRFPNSLVPENPLYQHAIREMYKSLQNEIHMLKELLKKQTSPTEIKKLKEQIQKRHLQSREMLHQELKLKELSDLQPLRDFQPEKERAQNPKRDLPVDSIAGFPQLPLQKIISLSPILLTLASFAALCLNFLGNKRGANKKSNEANEIRLGKTSITNTLEASPVINININTFGEAQEQRSSSKTLLPDGKAPESTESKIVDITEASSTVAPFQGTLPRTRILNASLGIDASAKDETDAPTSAKMTLEALKITFEALKITFEALKMASEEAKMAREESKRAREEAKITREESEIKPLEASAPPMPLAPSMVVSSATFGEGEDILTGTSIANTSLGISVPSEGGAKAQWRQRSLGIFEGTSNTSLDATSAINPNAIDPSATDAMILQKLSKEGKDATLSEIMPLNKDSPLARELPPWLEGSYSYVFVLALMALFLLVQFWILKTQFPAPPLDVAPVPIVS